MRFWHCPKPTIAAVRGPCLAGACELALACDLTIATEDAFFGEPELKFGAGIVVMLLPWIVGPKVAKEIILTGEDRVSAARAREIGMINRVVPAAKLDEEALRIARHIAAVDPNLVKETKRAINRAMEAQGMLEALEAALEIDLAIEGAGSPDKIQFMDIARRDGLKAALAWRDARFPKSSAVTAAPAERATRAAFVATIFLSALLLFSVQPMFAKMVLPTLGGAPAVWAVSMCFFQSLLLLGYAYAHLLDSYAPLRLALPLHLAVLAFALLALPIALPAGWAGVTGGSAYVQLIVILALGVGLPFFALAANAPLLQAWFARAGHAQSADAYFLYRASNAGSLVALAAYPTLIEPLLPLTVQSWLWAAGFVLLAVAVAACGYLARNGKPVEQVAASGVRRGGAP